MFSKVKYALGSVIGISIMCASLVASAGPMVGGGGMDPSIVISCPSGLEVIFDNLSSSDQNMWVKSSAQAEYRWIPVKVSADANNRRAIALFHPFCSQVLVEVSKSEWLLQMNCEGKSLDPQSCKSVSRGILRTDTNAN